MRKAEARQQLDSTTLPEAQLRAARRTLQRATNSEDIEIVIMASGDLLIRRTRPGKVGRQVFEDTIQPDGTKEVIQKAFDADGNLVHFDPKGGTP